MSNFFSSSGANDHPSGSGDDNFFSFKNDEESGDQAGGSLFGNSSSSLGGGDQGSFFKPPSASKNEANFLDFGSTFSKPDAEPTFLAPFSRTPPRKRQNQGPPSTPVCQPTPQQSAVDSKMQGSNTSPAQFKGNSDPSLEKSSYSAAYSLEPTPSSPSSNMSNSQAFGGASDSPAQQNSNVQSIPLAGKGCNDVNSQQHSPGIGFGKQAHTMENNSKGHDEPRQQSKEMSSGLMSESKSRVEEASLKIGREEKFGGATMPSGRTRGSFEGRLSGGQPMGREPIGATAVQGGQGLLKQLLAQQMQRLSELLAPELEKAVSKEERMVKELEQAEQHSKAYRLQLEGMKERFGGRLGQISGFLGMNTKK